MLAKMGTDFHVSNINLFEPRRTNNFELEIMFETDQTGSTVSENYTAMEASSSDYTSSLNNHSFSADMMKNVLLLSVKNFDAPKISIDPLEVHYGNNSTKYAGKPKFSSSNLTVYDYIGADVEGILSAWFKKTYDVVTEKVGLANDYKRTGKIRSYAPNGSCEKIWVMKGMWISDLDFGSYDQSGGLREVKATIQYDRALPEEYSTSDLNTSNLTSL